MSMWLCRSRVTLQPSLRGLLQLGVSSSSSAWSSSVSLKSLLASKPKRPLSPFLLYARERREKDQPRTSSNEFVEQLSKRWNALNPDIKDHYSQMYRKLKVEYDREMALFKARLAEENLEDKLNEWKEEESVLKRVTRARRELKRHEKELGKPKKIPSPFFLFIQVLITKSYLTLPIQ